jgi:hypothetical protein
LASAPVDIINSERPNYLELNVFNLVGTFIGSTG